MYDIISEIVGQVSPDQEFIIYIVGALIPLLTVVFVDFIKDIFSGFFRG